MFKKPPTLQSRTLLKSSASRAIKEQISATFPLLTADDLLLLFPHKSSLTCDKLSAPSHVSLFSVTPSRPLFFSYTPTAASSSSSSSSSTSPASTTTHFCPTVYALWLCPHILPPLFIHPAVTPALIRGADLMLPGILRPSNHSYNLRRGQLRCVVARGNPAPMAVGEVVVEEAEAVAGGWVGRGLRVLQCYGDGMWSGGGERVVPNEGFVGGKVEAVIGSEEARAMLDAAIEDGRAKGQSVDELLQLRQQVESKLKLTDDISQPSSDEHTADGTKQADTRSTAVVSADIQAVRSEDSDASLDASAERNGREAKEEKKETDLDEDDNGSSNTTASSERAVPVDVMDNSLYDSLLHAIKTDLPDDAFPLTPSVLLSRYMEACNPHPHRLELRHSSYKKMSKFVKAMAKHALLFVKEKQGELSVTAVHRQHPDVVAVVAGKEWRDAVKAKAKAREKEAKERERRREEEEGDGAGGLMEAEKQPLTVLHRYKPSAQLRAALFSDSEDELFTMKDAKQQLTDYCKQRGLDEGGGVRLDSVLAEAVMNGTATEATRLTKVTLVKAFESQLQLYTALVLPTDLTTARPTYHRGPPQPVTVTVEQRPGNRTVTRLSGLERYGVDVVEWGREAARRYAASVTSEESKAGGGGGGGGGGGKKGARDVLVQGDCRDGLVEQLWQEYGIPRELVKLEMKKGKGKK